MKWALLLGLLLVLPTQAQTGAKIVTAARQQVGVTLTYDPAYVTLKFPSGDVPRDRGVCTDVVIRALRDGLAQDLQALVNADMRAHFAAYPQQWGLSRTDRNIDHRRVPNLQTLFKRRGLTLKLAKPPDPAAFQPCDLVTCTVPPHLPHIMIVSDRKTPDGTRSLVIHNIGAGAREEDSLLTYPLTGHYRWR